MEKRNVILTLDKAKEWYKKGGELKEVALQAYTEEELTKIELPKTWEEFCDNYTTKEGECFISEYCGISPVTAGYIKESKFDKNILPSKEAAEAHLALMQLYQLRDCYRQGWAPDWEVNSTKYAICSFNETLIITCTVHYNYFLSFQTRELAEKFFANFKDLIEKAGDFI